MSVIDGRAVSEVNSEAPVQGQKVVPVVVKPQPQKMAGIGVFMCTMTLLGTKLGGGIVGIPAANKKIGYVTFQCMMTIYACMGMFSMWLLLRVREITRKESYPDLGIYLYGKWSVYFVNSLIALSQLGFPIIFFIVFGDVAKSLILEIDSGAGDFWTSRWFTHILLALVMLYLVILKEIHKLKMAGFFLLGLIAVFVFLLFIHYIISDPNPESSEDLTQTSLNVEFFAKIPTMIASFSFQPSLFTAFGSLKHKTTMNGLKAGWTAIWTAYITYTVTPLIAFGLYGSKVEDNLLNNLTGDSRALPIILQVIFLVIAVLHIPIIFFIGKEVLLIIFDEATRGSYSKQNVNRKVKVFIEKLRRLSSRKSIGQHQEEHQADEESKQNPVDQEVKENAQNDANQVDRQTPSQDSQPSSSRGSQRDTERNMNLRGPNPVQVQERRLSSKSDGPGEHPKANPKEYLNMHPFFYYLLTISIFGIVVLLSIVVGDVGVFYGIIGATAGCWIIIAGPGSFYIISVHKHNVELNTWTAKLSYIIAWIYTVLGFSGMIGLNVAVMLNNF
ncbi:unnamed protein product [Moneuplotes crassus]|uniref:Amino acid transporter transmembrane domain-containing protein n=1 Tax=Euplotes crassus TaxID=5936 RepID=A0AAD1UE74_EUPCR|nr:unnamed protein product [Moneuplotes crassus]